MLEVNQTLALAHAAREFPREACGLLVIHKGRETYVPCRNIGVGTDQFVIDPEDYVRADQLGEIVGVFHSHPNLPAEPSQADRVACEATALPWFIVSSPAGQWTELRPQGYAAPLVGREWSHGLLVRRCHHRHAGCAPGSRLPVHGCQRHRWRVRLPRIIRSTLGVRELVKFGGHPAKVDTDLITGLHEREQLQQANPKALFAAGDKVVITDGPFAGIEAIYQTTDAERRSMILLSMLNKPVPMRIEPGKLRKCG